MDNEELEQLIQAHIEDDDIELYRIFTTYKKHRLMLQAAHETLEQFPGAPFAYHTRLREMLSRADNPDTRSLAQDAVNETEFGLPEFLD